MAHRIPPLRTGHSLALLEGSSQYFPALVVALDGAQREAWLETYIFDFTASGTQVAEALERAARRGVNVRVVIDGFGSDAVPPEWGERLVAAGVQWRTFAPPGPFGLLWRRGWRRLHRKLVQVDGEVAFCGGINVLDDLHDPNHGTLDAPRFDFAVRVTGPLVADVRLAMQQLWSRMRTFRELRHGDLKQAIHTLRERVALVAWRRGARARASRERAADLTKRARAALALRDNLRHRASIERAYLRAIGRAREEVLIANAYFVPGHKMRRALVEAARRGVRVVLLLQGRYEYFLQYYAARPVYGALLRAGVAIHEYSPSFLHAKVAVIDGKWATVGSSNIDPLSLLLAREANVVVEDPDFAECLRSRLLHAVAHEGHPMDAALYADRPWHERLREGVALTLMRLALLVHGKRTYW
jgi:cardiolipin synthase